MNKSLDNVLSIDALTKNFPAVTVRWTLSAVHHRFAIEWDEETLSVATTIRSKFSGLMERSIGLTGKAYAEEILLPAPELPEGFVTAMNDSLNIVGALTVIHEYMKMSDMTIDEGDRTLARRE